MWRPATRTTVRAAASTCGAVTDGRAELDADVRRHLDLCLECRGCETACPSGVQYGKIIGSYKRDMTRFLPPAPTLTRLQRWMLFHLTPYAWRMRLALAPMRLMQWVGLGGLVRGMGRLMPRSLRLMQEIVPPLARHYGRLPEVLPAEGKRRARVALFTGCAADAFFPQTNLATARVLQRNGCEVWIPRTQVCCGALHYHAGLEAKAERLAADNCRAFGGRGGVTPPLHDGLDKVDAIINNAGGCGPVLKEYGHLLEKTPDAAAGAAFAAKSRDISEFLIELGPVKPTHPLPIKATYHDACGLSHAQKVRQPPRQLLGLIPAWSWSRCRRANCAAARPAATTSPSRRCRTRSAGARRRTSSPPGRRRCSPAMWVVFCRLSAICGR